MASLVFLALGGIEALLIRIQLFYPDNHFVSAELFNELFTMHGTTMIFLVVMPLLLGFLANFLIPLMIGARDVAFPRLNALSFWIFLFGGIFLHLGFFWHQRRTPQRRMVRLRQPDRADVHAGPAHRFLGRRPDHLGRRDGDDRGQLPRDHRSHARARHDLHADAAVRMDDAGDGRPDPARVSRAHRGSASSCSSIAFSARIFTRRWKARRRFCGSTCSGSSAIPRSTSWRCRPSASSPRCCRPSRASRCSATR